MLSDVTNEKIKYANCGENRELLIDEIIRIGILDVSGNPIAGCKERICELGVVNICAVFKPTKLSCFC